MAFSRDAACPTLVRTFVVSRGHSAEAAYRGLDGVPAGRGVLELAIYTWEGEAAARKTRGAAQRRASTRAAGEAARARAPECDARR